MTRRPLPLRGLAVLGVAAACAIPALAASPGTGAVAAAGDSVTVPSSAGQTAKATWEGTIPPGANATSDCSGQQLVDEHDFTVDVPGGVYTKVVANMAVEISWTQLGTGDASDEILTLVGPDGKTIGSSDGGNPSEQVAITNPKPGTYKAIACGFANAAPTDYKGSVTIKTSKIIPAPPNDPRHGLKFSATVPADPQRDEGEPAITTDRAGNMYTCGPTGFSQMNDYAQVSTDGGDQFHLVGTPPRGQLGHAQAGGDCALATAKEKNEDGHYQLAYAGLGPLTGFSTATSADTGRTVVGSPDSESIPAVDRQWIAFSDDKTAFLNYNHSALGQVVQKSTDGGLTYAPPQTAATDGGRIGQIRAIPASITGSKPYIYFPYSAGTLVKIALSKDGGDTWSQCVAVDAKAGPDAGFVSADNDRKGNVYVSYAEQGAGRDVYMVSAKFRNFKHCQGPSDDSAKNNKNPGFTKKVRMNRKPVETTVMPWVTASGRPGRAAVAFYGTKPVGDPDSPDFHTSWFVYVSQTTDAFRATPHVGMVRASTHPFHFDSICLAGLGCDIAGADRSLVDYFTMDYDPKRGGLVIVYSQANKLPGDAEGVVSIPAVVTQIAGPSNGGGKVHRHGRKPLRKASPDHKGDAISRYSITNVGTDTRDANSVKVPALDLVNRNGEKAVTIGKLKKGGFRVTMRFKNLSDDALQQALTATSNGQPGSLVYAFRFYSGYRPVAAVAKYDPVSKFTFGFSKFEVSTDCGANASTADPDVKGKCEIYPGTDAPLKGRVDSQSSSITLKVPASYLQGLGKGLKHGKRYPGLVKATKGTRMYDGTAFTFVNDSPSPEQQSWLQQVDNAPAFDFRVPSAPRTTSAGVAVSPAAAGAPASGPGSGAGLGAAALLAGTAASVVLVRRTSRRRMVATTAG